MSRLDLFRQSPSLIAKDYQRSHVASRIMLTGHIFQSTPDCSFDGQQQAWLNMASNGEERWEVIFEQADAVREGFAGLIHSRSQNIALAGSVHELFVRFLSALPLARRPKIVTTDSEPPSIDRQLDRLTEFGIEVVKVAAQPASTAMLRVEEAIDDKTAAVCVSSVFFNNGHLALEMDTLLPVCQRYGAELFVNASQSVYVLSFSIEDYNLEEAFVVSGCATYCQMGDGISFMHVPSDCKLKPAISSLLGAAAVTDNPAVMASQLGVDHSGFDGSTIDSSSYFRAKNVLDYFLAQQMDPEFLHDLNHHQLSLIARHFQHFDFDPTVIELSTGVEFMGGFISFRSPFAHKIYEIMRDHGVHTDTCGEYLRMGPAPYLCDEQLEDAVQALEEAVDHIVKTV